MIACLFASHFNLFLVLVSLFFRSVRAAHDGLCDRGSVLRSLPNKPFNNVGAWPWHLLNWLGRDLLIAALYLWMFFANGLPGVTLLGVIVCNFIIHDFCYWYVYSHRRLFLWGDEFEFKFPSLFRKVFGR